MPDLTIESCWSCCSNQDWETEVTGSTGNKYTVRFDRHSHRNHSVMYDYSCTCKGYEIRKTCSHITDVRKKKLRCGWRGQRPIEKNGKRVCPQCGDEVFVERHAV